MSRGPIVDVEFEVVTDPHPTVQELAERDAYLAKVDAEMKRTDLRGWRLWLAIVVTIAIAWPIFGGVQLAVRWFVGLFMDPPG